MMMVMMTISDDHHLDGDDGCGGDDYDDEDNDDEDGAGLAGPLNRPTR